MIQEIKLKMEQSAEAFAAFDTTAHSVTGNFDAAKRGYSAACKDILENPGEWGLADMDEITQAHLRYFKAVRKATKYGEALERIIQQHDQNIPDSCSLARGLAVIAKEALKQEVNND